jgi:hypothetical protein
MTVIDPAATLQVSDNDKVLEPLQALDTGLRSPEHLRR